MGFDKVLKLKQLKTGTMHSLAWYQQIDHRISKKLGQIVVGESCFQVQFHGLYWNRKFCIFCFHLILYTGPFWRASARCSFTVSGYDILLPLLCHCTHGDLEYRPLLWKFYWAISFSRWQMSGKCKQPFGYRILSSLLFLWFL